MLLRRQSRRGAWHAAHGAFAYHIIRAWVEGRGWVRLTRAPRPRPSDPLRRHPRADEVFQVERVPRLPEDAGPVGSPVNGGCAANAAVASRGGDGRHWPAR